MDDERRPEPVEPSADIRRATSAIRQLYVGLMYEGFTEHQALIIIGQVLAAQRKDGDA